MDINFNTNLKDVEKYIIEQSKNLRFLCLEHDIFKIAELIKECDEKVYNIEMDLYKDNNEYILSIYLRDKNDEIIDYSINECLMMTSDDYLYYYNSQEINFSFELELNNYKDIEYKLANKMMGKFNADNWYSKKFAFKLDDEISKANNISTRKNKI